jgi:hypothetical protein
VVEIPCGFKSRPAHQRLVTRTFPLTSFLRLGGGLWNRTVAKSDDTFGFRAKEAQDRTGGG